MSFSSHSSSPGPSSGTASKRDLKVASFLAKHQLDFNAAEPVITDLTAHDLNVIVSAFDPALANGEKEVLLRRFVQVYIAQKTQAFIQMWGLVESPAKDLLSRLSHKDRGLVMERFQLPDGHAMSDREKHAVLKALVHKRMECRIDSFLDRWNFGDSAPSCKRLLQKLAVGDLQVVLSSYDPNVFPKGSRRALLVRTVDVYISRKIEAFVQFWRLDSVREQVVKVLTQLWHQEELGTVLERVKLGGSSVSAKQKLARLHRFVHRLVSRRVGRFAKEECLSNEPLWAMAVQTLSVRKLLMLVDQYDNEEGECPSQALGRHITKVSHAPVATPPEGRPRCVSELQALLARGEASLHDDVVRELKRMEAITAVASMRE